MFHQGERAVQRRAGLAVDGWGSAGVDAVIPPVAAEFLAQQRMVVLGAATDDGTVWTSALTGPAGFVTAADDRTVVAAGVPDGPLAGLFDTERDIGMLAIEPATRRRMRVNGRAHVADGRLLVRTEQVYANCPKYIQTRTLGEDGPATAGEPRYATELTADQRHWITTADTFFITTHAAGLGADTSHRGGNPGFVTVTGQRLSWPDYTGNSMYMTLGNLELDPRCGLLFLDWEHGGALQLTGRAKADWDPVRAAATPGAHRMIDFEVEQVVETGGTSPLRWSFEKYSRFNPS